MAMMSVLQVLPVTGGISTRTGAGPPADAEPAGDAAPAEGGLVAGPLHPASARVIAIRTSARIATGASGRERRGGIQWCVLVAVDPLGAGENLELDGADMGAVRAGPVQALPRSSHSLVGESGLGRGNGVEEVAGIDEHVTRHDGAERGHVEAAVLGPVG